MKDNLIQETAETIAPKLVADNVKLELTMKQASLIMKYEQMLKLAEKYADTTPTNTDWRVEAPGMFCLDQTIAWDYEFEKCDDETREKLIKGSVKK